MESLYKTRHYIHFPKLYGRFGGNVKVELDLSNYKRKGDLKGATKIDASKSNLHQNLHQNQIKAEVDKIDIEKLNKVPLDLSKLSNVVNNKVIKKLLKVNAIDTREFVLKTKYDTINQIWIRKLMTRTKKYLILAALFKKQIITLKLKK